MNIFEEANAWVADNELDFIGRLFPDLELRESERFQVCPACGAGSKMGVQGCFHQNCEFGGPMTPVFFAANVLNVRPIQAAKWIVGEEDVVNEDQITRIRRRSNRMKKWRPEKADQIDPVQLPHERVPISGPALDYLRGRGIDKQTINDFGISWCKTGMWRDRIIIPVLDMSGREVFFIGRAVFDDMESKYRYPSGSAKSRIIFAAPAGDEVTLVEGPFDALRWTQLGVPTGSILGAVMSPTQLQIIVRHYSKVTTAFDGDLAGFQCAKDVRQRVAHLVDEFRVAELPDGVDPADCDPRDVLPGELIESNNDITRVRRKARRLRSVVHA